MHKLALKILPLAELPGTASAEGRQLDCSISVRDACIALSHQKKPVRQVICIAGHPGSGRSTYTQAVFQELVHSGSMSYSEILFLVVGPYDSISSVWNSGIEIAKANNDRGVVALLASNTTARDVKLKAMVRLLNNFKTICFDDLDAKNEELCSFLLTLVKKLNNNVICVSHLNHSPCIKIADVCITVNGLYPEAVKSLVLKNTKIDRKRLESIYKSFKHNPTAIQLYLNSCLLFGKCEVTSTAEEDPPTCSVLEMIWEQLSDLERHALVQLSELRQPLPMKAEAGTLARVVQIGLVKSKNMSMSGRGTCRLISMANCVKNFVQSKNSSISPLEMDKKFNVFNCWTTLLTDELLGLLEDAKNNSWPFIPEKW